MKIAFHFLGCRLNEAENEQMARTFVEAGHCMVQLDENPDVILLNTCGVTAEAMRKSRNYARRMAAYCPKLLVLTGCAIDLMAAGENPMEDSELIDCASEKEGAHSEMKILRILRADKPRAAQMVLKAIDELDEIEAHHTIDDAEKLQAAASYRLRMRSFIKIQDGCNNQCTYCAVRLARGTERSENTDDILCEIRKCIALGEREFVLTGVQLGAWKENDRRLKDLIRDILDKTDVQRLRIGSIEPWHIKQELWTLWKDRRLCPHFHIPVQSGSDAVLTAMRRRTPIDGYLEKVDAIRRDVADARISTDLIVGFPGETEEMWQETLEFIRRAQFDNVHLFRFSSRPGTLAAAMRDQISAENKRKRWNEAESLIRDIQKKRLENAVGSTGNVLWEMAVRSENGKTLWQGYSENYLQFNRWFDESKINRGDVTEEIFTKDDISPNMEI